MKTYEAIRISGTPDWNQIPETPIDHYLWSDVRSIRAFAQLCWEPDALHVRLRAVEPNILSRYDGLLDPVFCDSCLEFFFCPGSDDRYFNFECNPKGSLYVGFGRANPQRARLYREDWKSLLQTQPFTTDDGWGISLRIPASFIRWFVPDFKPAAGLTLRGNFFKCGDETLQPHYMSWNRVESATPCFHLPAFFGTIVLK